VGNCDKLPAAGQWENISPPGSHYTETTVGVQQPVIRPDKPATIFVGADSHGIFRSDDCGAHWTGPINTGKNAAALSSGRPWSMQIDPVDPEVMYAAEGYGNGGLFKTTNAGVDWEQVFPDTLVKAINEAGQVDSVAIDPTDHTHLVVEPHGTTGASGTCASGCVLESTDSGGTWKTLSAPAWQENSAVAVLDTKTWLFCFLFGGIVRTSDQGASWQNVTTASASCNYYAAFAYRAMNGMYYLASGPGVLQSSDGKGAKWSVIPMGHDRTTLVGTGKTLIAGDQWSNTFFSAPESQAAEPTAWKSFPAPAGPASEWGSAYLSYDPYHHILYSSHMRYGLFRVVIE
jgi:photosystem II stability/assembly factor-like uncharacterized protein